MTFFQGFPQQGDFQKKSLQPPLLFVLQQKDTAHSKKVGVEFAQTGESCRNGDLFFDLKVQFAAKFPEVINGAQMDIGRIVPVIGDLRRPGHLTLEHQLETA